jgi:hydroxymethylpyrimidine pyrophosphatase-like HAD family hydrolase
MNIKTTVIFDLDGTLALVDKRREIAKKPNGKIDFDIFYDPQYIELDEPNPSVIELAKMYKRNGYEIVIVSGRSDRTKEATERWLEKYGILYDRMIMRKRKNFTPDNELKERWLEKYLDRDDIRVVVDDRQRVVDMWRRNGLDVFQVANGNF